MLPADANLLSNDPGADQSGVSSVFSQAFQGAADVIRALNQPQIAAQQTQAQTAMSKTLLWGAGLIFLMWLVMKG